MYGERQSEKKKGNKEYWGIFFHGGILASSDNLRPSEPSGPVPTACMGSHPCPGGGTTGERCQHMRGAFVGWLQSPHSCFRIYPLSPVYCVCMNFSVQLPQHFPRVALHKCTLFSHDPGRYNSNILVIFTSLFSSDSLLCTKRFVEHELNCFLACYQIIH